MKRFFCLLLGSLVLILSATAATTSRTYRAGQLGVSVNGVAVAGGVSWLGGQPRGTLQVSGAKKQLSGFTYDPVVIEVSAALTQPLLGLVTGFCAGQATPVTLLLTEGGLSSLEVKQAVLTQVEFPELDGASKERAAIVLTFSVGSSASLPPSTALSGPKTKAALSSNFRFVVDGLPSNRIASVSGLTLSREGGRLAVSNLIVSLSAVDAAAWTQWRDEFVVQGKNSDAQEKNATLTLLDASMGNPLLSLVLSRVGLIRTDATTRGGEAISRLEAELYVESVSVVPNAGKQAAATEPTVKEEDAQAVLREKEHDLASLELRRKSLAEILARQEAEKKTLDPTASETWEKTRLPVLTRMIATSKSDLAEVEQQMKAIQNEMAAQKKATTSAVNPTKTAPTIRP